MQLSLKLTSIASTVEVLCPTSGAKVVATTREPFLAQLYRGNNISAANHVGRLLAQRLKESGVGHIYMNFYGMYYHGKVKAILDQLKAGGVVVHSEPYLQTSHLHSTAATNFNPLPHEVKLPVEYFPSTLEKVKIKRRLPGYEKSTMFPMFEEDAMRKGSKKYVVELHPNHPDHPDNKNKKAKK